MGEQLNLKKAEKFFIVNESNKNFIETYFKRINDFWNYISPILFFNEEKLLNERCSYNDLFIWGFGKDEMFNRYEELREELKKIASIMGKTFDYNYELTQFSDMFFCLDKIYDLTIVIHNRFESKDAWINRAFKNTLNTLCTYIGFELKTESWDNQNDYIYNINYATRLNILRNEFFNEGMKYLREHPETTGCMVSGEDDLKNYIRQKLPTFIDDHHNKLEVIN